MTDGGTTAWALAIQQRQAAAERCRAWLVHAYWSQIEALRAPSWLQWPYLPVHSGDGVFGAGTVTRVLQHGGGLYSRSNLLGFGSSAGLYGPTGPSQTQLRLVCLVAMSDQLPPSGRWSPLVVVVLLAPIQGTISLCLAGLVAGASVRRRWGFVTEVAYDGGWRASRCSGFDLAGLLCIGSPRGFG
jgi:hypothetical protein